MVPFPHIFSYECFNECMYKGFVRNSIRLATGELNSNVSYHMPCLVCKTFVFNEVYTQYNKNGPFSSYFVLMF